MVCLISAHCEVRERLCPVSRVYSTNYSCEHYSTRVLIFLCVTLSVCVCCVCGDINTYSPTKWLALINVVWKYMFTGTQKAINRTLIHTHRKHTHSPSTGIWFPLEVNIRKLSCLLFGLSITVWLGVYFCVWVWCWAAVPCRQCDPYVRMCTTGPCASYSACLCFIKTPLNFLILPNQKQLQRILLIHKSWGECFICISLTHTHTHIG